MSVAYSKYCKLLALMLFFPLFFSPTSGNVELSLENSLPRKLSLNWSQMLQ